MNKTVNRAALLRIIVKAVLLFGLCNLVYAAVYPVEWLGRTSLYNSVLPGRTRLPYGERPAQDYNLSLYNLNAMLAAHVISQPKATDEYRVLLIGDSATWGWFLAADETYSARLNAMKLTVNGQTVRAYNLGYPVMSLTKDLMLLDAARQFEPDFVIWLVSLESFPYDKQLFPPIVQNNPNAVQPLITTYDLNLPLDDPQWVPPPTFAERTLIGQRRPLADLLRLQLYGVAWAATGIDQDIPADIPLNNNDLDASQAWGEAYPDPVPLTTDDLAFEVIQAGVDMMDDTPLILVNEPMFISSGDNSDIRYNTLFPKWAYDAYREQFQQQSRENDWLYVDWWDSIDPVYFSDSPVHLNAQGADQLAAMLADLIANTPQAEE